MSLSCHSPSWQWLPECCWQQTRNMLSDGAVSGSEHFVFKNGLGQNFLWSRPTMSAVLSAVGCGGGGSFELQLENEQKWLIYGPATRTHEGARGRRTNRTNNKYIAHRPHSRSARIRWPRAQCRVMSCHILALSRCVRPSVHRPIPCASCITRPSRVGRGSVKVV